MSYLQMLRRSSEQVETETPLSGSLADGDIRAAMHLLNLSGTRIIASSPEFLVGLWEDLDGPEIRAALRLIGIYTHQIVHLEGANVPLRYKVRSCPDRHQGERFSSWLRRAEQEWLRRLEQAFPGARCNEVSP